MLSGGVDLLAALRMRSSNIDRSLAGICMETHTQNQAGTATLYILYSTSQRKLTVSHTIARSRNNRVRLLRAKERDRMQYSRKISNMNIFILTIVARITNVPSEKHTAPKWQSSFPTVLTFRSVSLSSLTIASYKNVHMQACLSLVFPNAFCSSSSLSLGSTSHCLMHMSTRKHGYNKRFRRF